MSRFSLAVTNQAQLRPSMAAMKVAAGTCGNGMLLQLLQPCLRHLLRQAGVQLLCNNAGSGWVCATDHHNLQQNLTAAAELDCMQICSVCAHQVTQKAVQSFCCCTGAVRLFACCTTAGHLKGCHFACVLQHMLGQIQQAQELALRGRCDRIGSLKLVTALADTQDLCCKL